MVDRELLPPAAPALINLAERDWPENIATTEKHTMSQTRQHPNVPDRRFHFAASRRIEPARRPEPLVRAIARMLGPDRDRPFATRLSEARGLLEQSFAAVHVPTTHGRHSRERRRL